MNASFICSLFSSHIDQLFPRYLYFLFPSCIIPADQRKFNCRKRIEESKHSSTTKIRRLVLNNLFLLIETSSVAKGCIKVCKKMFLKKCF